MSAFNLTVNVDNAAFDPDPRPELARILRAAADVLESGERRDDIGWYQTILDVNGNDVGRFALKNADGSPWQHGWGES
jgi:hypothetical protein